VRWRRIEFELMTSKSSCAYAQERERPSPEIVAKKHAEIAERYAEKEQRREKRPPLGMAWLRIHELGRLFQHRWGPTLPDDDSGREDLLIAMHHLAQTGGNPRKAMKNCADICAPWMGADDLDQMIDRVIRRPLRWTAQKLGELVNLTEAERTHLRINTFRSVGVDGAAL
jgi:hypothetical protein